MLTVLFSVKMPVNCYQVMISIMKLTNLDIIPVEDLIQSFFNFQVDTSPLSDVFEEAGYESSNFLMELGALLVIMICSVLLYILRFIILLVTSR